jgi:hypothetical protein
MQRLWVIRYPEHWCWCFYLIAQADIVDFCNSSNWKCRNRFLSLASLNPRLKNDRVNSKAVCLSVQFFFVNIFPSDHPILFSIFVNPKIPDQNMYTSWLNHFTCDQPSNFAVDVKLSSCIPAVIDSNFHLDTEYPYWVFYGFISPSR